MPLLQRHVPWEGFGERAALLLADNRPGLENVISQPERLRLTVRGKRVAYTPDYALTFSDGRSEVWEIKGHRQLEDLRTQEKLAAAELELAKTNRIFHVFDSRDLSSRTELRNAQVLRRYGRYRVTNEQNLSIRTAFRSLSKMSLGVLISAASDYGITREQIYALLYSGVLTFDWSSFVSDETLVSVGGL